jgi:two-component system phosphate regulon sensor histidine kinase PhoR
VEFGIRNGISYFLRIPHSAFRIADVMIYLLIFLIAVLAATCWWLASRLHVLRLEKLSYARDLAGHQLASGHLERRSGGLEAALESMEEGVLAVDGSGRVLLMNPRLEDLLGMKHGESLGKPLLSVLRDPAIRQMMEGALTGGGGTQVRELILFVPEERIFSVRVSPLRVDESASPAGAAALFLDVTRERKLERMRSEFVANASHELKTPLTAIRASLETLAEGALEDPEVNREFLQKALRHTERLSQLIGDLLSLSAIEDRQRRGQPTGRGSLAQALAGSLSLLESKTKARRLRIQSQLDPALPEVKLDEEPLGQVLTNILDNACKYSPEGGVIHLSALTQAGSILVEVADQGPGIPAADQPRLFERFYRVDKARSRDLGGTGLGLSIVKHLVEGAGGKVGLRSEPGQGSTFWFSLPLA